MSATRSIGNDIENVAVARDICAHFLEEMNRVKG
jgi:hypothetical protein